MLSTLAPPAHFCCRKVSFVLIFSNHYSIENRIRALFFHTIVHKPSIIAVQRNETIASQCSNQTLNGFPKKLFCFISRFLL